MKLNHHHLLVVLATCLFIASCKEPPPPVQFVHASSKPDSSGWSPFVRISPDGLVWSEPIFPLDQGGNPVRSEPSTPVGIGSNGLSYKLVWFGPGGALRSRTSPDGVSWRNEETHGSWPVNSLSRPAVAEKDGVWYCAIRTQNGNVVALPLAGSTTSRNPIAHPDGTPVVATDSPALAFGNDRFVLAYRESTSSSPGNIRIVVADEIDELAGPGAFIPAPSAITPPLPGPNLSADDPPYLTFADGRFYLAISRELPGAPPQPEIFGDSHSRISSGQIVVLSSSDGSSWSHSYSLRPSNRDSQGVAIAGPPGNQVVVDPFAGWPWTDVWVNESLAPGTTMASRPFGPSSLAHGPGGGYSLQILFNHKFQVLHDTTVTSGDDLVLHVQHLDGDGNLLREMVTEEFSNIDHTASHHWAAGSDGFHLIPPDNPDGPWRPFRQFGANNEPFPLFRAVLLPGHSIRVFVMEVDNFPDADDGPYEAPIEFDLFSPLSGRHAFTTEDTNGSPRHSIPATVTIVPN